MSHNAYHVPTWWPSVRRISELRHWEGETGPCSITKRSYLYERVESRRVNTKGRSRRPQNGRQPQPVSGGLRQPLTKRHHGREDHPTGLSSVDGIVRGRNKGYLQWDVLVTRDDPETGDVVLKPSTGVPLTTVVTLQGGHETRRV